MFTYPNMRPVTQMWIDSGRVETILDKLPAGLHSQDRVFERLITVAYDNGVSVPGEPIVWIEQGFKTPFDYGMPQKYRFTYYVVPREYCQFEHTSDGEFHVNSGNLYSRSEYRST